jgi:hypothetical protein
MPDELSDGAFRARLREVLARSRLSARQFSAACGRDPGYASALLDPTRPSRARPTPGDLLRLSDATGIPFTELLEQLWAIPGERLAAELGAFVSGRPDLTASERRELADFAAYLVMRRRRTRG